MLPSCSSTACVFASGENAAKHANSENKFNVFRRTPVRSINRSISLSLNSRAGTRRYRASEPWRPDRLSPRLPPLPVNSLPSNAPPIYIAGGSRLFSASPAPRIPPHWWSFRDSGRSHAADNRGIRPVEGTTSPLGRPGPRPAVPLACCGARETGPEEARCVESNARRIQRDYKSASPKVAKEDNRPTRFDRRRVAQGGMWLTTSPLFRDLLHELPAYRSAMDQLIAALVTHSVERPRLRNGRHAQARF